MQTTKRRFHCGFTIESDGSDVTPEVTTKEIHRAFKKALKVGLLRKGRVSGVSVSESINEIRDEPKPELVKE